MYKHFYLKPLTLNLNICRYDLWWMPTFNIKCPPKYIYPDWQANYNVFFCYLDRSCSYLVKNTISVNY